MAKAHRLLDLDIGETSGVDHPAHLHPGWLVIKNEDGLRDVLERARRTDKATKEPSTMPDGIDLDSIADEDTRKAVAALISEHDDLAKQASETAVDEAINKARGEWEADLSALAADGDDSEDDVTKGLPDEVRKMLDDKDEAIAKAQAAADAAEAIAKAERFRHAEVEAVNKARATLPNIAGAQDGSLGKALLALHLNQPDVADVIEKALGAANGQLDSADIFRSIGSANEASADAATRLDDLAKSRAAEKGESFEVAYTEVLSSDEGRALHRELRGGTV